MITTLLSCQCDSIVTKACGALIPIIKEACKPDTNDFDVCIADVICKSLVIIVTILVAGFLAWKWMELREKKDERKFKNQKEKEESERKQEGNKLDREWKLEDENRKHAFDMLTRKLEILHELCYDLTKEGWKSEDCTETKECKEDKENKETKERKEAKKYAKVLKGADKKEINHYLFELEEALKQYSTPTNNS